MKNTQPNITVLTTRCRPGITMVELIIAIVISLIVVGTIGLVLVDSQRGWRTMWEKTNADVVSGGFAAGRRFDSALRKASSIAANVAEDGSSIEVYCYEDSGSTNLDRYQRMFKSGDDLMYEYGRLFPRETIFMQTVCGNVTGCIFNHLHRGAQMTLTLDDGEQTNTVVTSAYMHNY